MHIAGGVSAAYRRVIEAADNPEEKRREIEAELQSLASPFRTAEATGQDIIDPAETRSLLEEFVCETQRISLKQVALHSLSYRP
jgi:acetyl-CoA carboxylase carboxyltransferase component